MLSPDLSLLDLEDFELAVESAIKAAYPGRQKKKNFQEEMAVARGAFRRRLRALVKKHGGNVNGPW